MIRCVCLRYMVYLCRYINDNGGRDEIWSTNWKPRAVSILTNFRLLAVSDGSWRVDEFIMKTEIILGNNFKKRYMLENFCD